MVLFNKQTRYNYSLYVQSLHILTVCYMNVLTPAWPHTNFKTWHITVPEVSLKVKMGTYQTGHVFTVHFVVIIIYTCAVKIQKATDSMFFIMFLFYKAIMIIFYITSMY